MNVTYQKDIPLKDYTTLHIGGPARRFYSPRTVEEIEAVLALARQEGVPLFVLGNGSNVLFDDEGYNGWILHLAGNWSGIELVDPYRLRVKSGTTNQELARYTALAGLAGYAFASGIPGTIGGAITMNAGAYNGETADVLESVRWIDREGNIHTTHKNDLDLSYRHSRFSDGSGIILDAVYRFRPGDTLAIRHDMEDLHQKRWDKQPMDDYSAGSTFKRPKNAFASQLIHENGLQGTSVGDAEVSTKHAGFLINKGNATAKEFLELVSNVQKTIKDNTGIELELEVKHIPYEE